MIRVIDRDTGAVLFVVNKSTEVEAKVNKNPEKIKGRDIGVERTSSGKGSTFLPLHFYLNL